MTVNGLQFPASFVEFFEIEWNTMWELKEDVDAYGNPFQADFEPHGSVESMEEFAAVLEQYFRPPDQHEGQGAMSPAFLFDISDFSQIACFVRTAGGAPYCFDFRESPLEPSVIHHDDRYAHWRRIAPNFSTFISLFKRYEIE